MSSPNHKTSAKSQTPGLANGVRIVLASASPRRHDILALTGLSFEVGVDDAEVVEITSAEEPDAEQLTVRNANLKLNSAVDRADNSRWSNLVTIAADTTVSIDGDILGKPVDRREATEMLVRLRGRRHQVITSVAVDIDLVDRQRETRCRSVKSGVKLRRYEDDEIERYIASGIPFDRAGAYGIQDANFDPAESVSGCYLNVVGLPLCALRELLPSSVAKFTNAHVYVSCAAHERGGVG